MPKEGTYITIQSWMVTDLHLKGNELLTYAIIFGFTQDGSWYQGTRGYIAEWCGCSKDTVSRCLNALLDKGYIERQEMAVNNMIFNHYRAMQNAYTPYANCIGGVCKMPSINKDKYNYKDIKKTNKRKSRSVNLDEEATDYPFSSECLKAFNDQTGKEHRVLPRYIADFLEAQSGRYDIADVEKMVKVKADYFKAIKRPENIRPATFFRESNFPVYMDDATNKEVDHTLDWLEAYPDD